MIKNYLKEIEKLKSPISNEHTYRTPLENLLKSFAVKLYPNSNISIQQEVSAEKKIFPDFTAMDEDKGIIGFIECKDIGFDLHKAIEGNGNFKIYKEQLLKYLNKHNNLIYTDYINFIYLTLDKNQIKIKNEISLYSKDLDNNIKILENMLEDFFVYKIKEIDKKDYFLSTLARKTNILKIYIELELENKESYLKNHIKGLFEDTIFNDLSDKDFADAFSQIISFSLLFYRLNERKNVDLNSFRNMPEYIPIFREFLSTINFDNLDENIRYVINLIIKSINSYDEKIFYDKLSYKERHDTDKEDPFIYAYEYFLKEFDSKTRNARGVFYTPIEAVRYIIKSIDEILKDRLNISDGIYGEEVHILDFAAGTGTFMLGAIERAFENAKKNGISGVWENIVSDFILKRLYGFEFLIVPYVLAHFRIHEYLKDLNYDYKKNDRLQLYLTNTLDNSAGGQVKMFPQMQAESDNAYRIKNEEPILVIMGNPPYNNKSEEINRKEWIENLLKDYKENLNEKKINLDDDYIKFIRFAHWKMENAEKGIIGIIVNNSFINGLTHREMRRKLMQTFDEIYILDLHGNVNKGERCPDGSMDFNIFNIKEVGVCIALFVKTGLKNNKNKGIYFNEVFGTQDYKKNYLIDKSIADEKWVELEDDKKWHWFTKVKSNEKYLKEFIGLTEIFNLFGSGCKTERDYITIHITEEELKNTILDFNNLSENKLTEKYNTKVSRDWSVDRAKKDIMENYKKYKFDLITKINYRPFDIRYTYYTGTSKGFLGTPSRKIGYNFINRKNIGLIFPRQIAGAYGFQHGLVSEFIIDVATGGAKTGSETYFAPLYLYEENSAGEFKLDSSCKPNWTDSFKEFLKNYISDNPKEILNYIYAILYSPTYRENYKEDLKYDYPRIPFTKDKKIFDRLQKLGGELIDLHLLKKVPQSNAGYPNKGEHKISYSKYNEVEKRLYINEKQYFENVKKEVYNYSIGGYKPIEKYIKARDILTLKDISHLIKVIAVIERTIYLQEEIDKVWREADF
ncbi:type ISP restriction/modification enzyme [Brachyspira aalborgi]|jgi:predicted helicase|uniref:site-specific DNA-methyltransferase (adenine-specific) n=1 Tax=Brachyspira aalborgi TaxID=29522 RepID=A0ABY3K8C5_9SPIR|nr:type ISP restriction/modification enzyme [Brachyspira aalborgi]TXJ32209.1 adenine methyltransferase [Brachyspira aalborgi]TXJ42568.1 adenine methyltransferase [Brachyspira aalborgi]